MSKEVSYSEKLECRECLNLAPMRVIGIVKDTKESEQEHGPPVEHGILYEVLSCPKCGQVTIRSGSWNDLMDVEHWHGKVIYPNERQGIEGLPPSVEKEFLEAERVASISVNLYAVALGRVLEAVCDDRKVTGETLHKRLSDLAVRQEIPKHLAEMADKLRQLRNIGAHVGIGVLSDKEVPVLDALCRAVLEYVYSAPKLVERVEVLVAKLKAG